MLDIGPGSHGKGEGSGAKTEMPRDMVGENEILSNRDKSRHNENRGLDGNQVRNDQCQDHAANRTPEE